IERKSPDILYFPHKSFAEFLASRALLRRVREGLPTGHSAAVLTTEVLSFFRESATRRDLEKVVVSWPLHARLFEALAGQEPDSLRNVLARGEVITALAGSVLQLPRVSTFYVLSHWIHLSRLPRPLDGEAREAMLDAAHQLAAASDGGLHD